MQQYIIPLSKACKSSADSSTNQNRYRTPFSKQWVQQSAYNSHFIDFAKNSARKFWIFHTKWCAFNITYHAILKAISPFKGLQKSADKSYSFIFLRKVAKKLENITQKVIFHCFLQAIILLHPFLCMRHFHTWFWCTPHYIKSLAI